MFYISQLRITNSVLSFLIVTTSNTFTHHRAVAFASIDGPIRRRRIPTSPRRAAPTSTEAIPAGPGLFRNRRQVSQKALRIDVHRHPHAAARGTAPRRSARAGTFSSAASRRLHRQPEAVAPAQHRDRRLGGAEQRDSSPCGAPPSGATRQPFPAAWRGRRGPARARAPPPRPCPPPRRRSPQPPERRQAAPPALLASSA